MPRWPPHETAGREIVRAYWRGDWQAKHKEGHFEQFWQKALHDGVIADTAFHPKSVRLVDGWQRELTTASVSPLPKGEGAGFDVIFLPDPTIYDGSWANNGWLQELPKPLTKLAWGNAAILSPATAKQLGVALGSYAHGGEHGGYYMPVVELTLDGRSVRAPVWIMPGHADGTVTVWLGHGRTRAGRVGGSGRQRVGFDAYTLRTADHPWHAAGCEGRQDRPGRAGGLHAGPSLHGRPRARSRRHAGPVPAATGVHRGARRATSDGDQATTFRPA